MFFESLEYPTESDNIIRQYGIAVLLSLGAIFLIPIFILSGYYIKAMKKTFEGEDQLPEFDEFGKLLRDGLKFTGIIFGYMFLLILTVIPMIALGVTTKIGLLAGGFSLTTAMILMYVMPAGIANFAKENSARSAFNFREVFKMASTWKYLKMISILSIMFIFFYITRIILFLVLLITIIGIPAIIIVMPAFTFYENLFYFRMLAESVEN